MAVRFLGFVVLVSGLLLVSEGSLCGARVERFYKRKRESENDAALSMVYGWICTAKGIKPMGNVPSTRYLYDMLDPFSSKNVDHLKYSNLVESINDISSTLSIESTHRMSIKVKPIRIPILENAMNQFWTALNGDGHSMASREAFSYLVRLGYRYGVVGYPVKNTSRSVLKTQETLQAFFDSITSNFTLLSRVLGVALPAQTFGLVISTRSSMSEELAMVQLIAPDLVAAISSEVDSIIMLPLQGTVDENPSEYLLRDPGDRQRFYDDISSLKAAANTTDHDTCTEQGFVAIRKVLAKSAPHSSILLITDTPPDPSISIERHQVLSAATGKGVQVHFVLEEGGCMSTTSEGFEVYRELAKATGGTLLSSVQSVPSLFNFIMASRAKTPFVPVPGNGSGISRLRVPALNADSASQYGDRHGLNPFQPTEETFQMLQASTNCHEFLTTALDNNINVVATATENEQALFLQEPGYTAYLKYFGPEVLNLSIHAPTPGRWKACSQKEFGLYIGVSQLYDFSLEYLRYHKMNDHNFKITRTPTGCGSRQVVLRSPRMHLISDSCPLMVNIYHMGNGSLFRSVRLRKCEYRQGGFLQARLQLIPKPLVYRVSGCDGHGNHFERAILTPFFTPRIAMVTLTRDPLDYVARTNTSSIASFTVQSMEHEPVTISFKVGLRLAKDSDRTVVDKMPRRLYLGPGECGRVTFNFTFVSKASNGFSNITERAIITPLLTASTGMRRRACPIIHRFYQEAPMNVIANKAVEAAGDSCSRSCQNGFCSTDNICICDPQHTGKSCDLPVCILPCQHKGQCIAPDTCKCPEGFTGDQCEAPICDPLCQNGGQCINASTCECSHGYTGPACTTPICGQVCENSGTCVAPDTCSCTVGYTGELCETAVCNPPCQNGGNCSSEHTCECGPHYMGASCSSPICNRRCLNGGTCTSPDTCSCASGYTGRRCRKAICNEPCRNGGTCTAPNVCACADGYMGQLCEVPVCSRECQNGGICIGKDECQCEMGYSGLHCESAICTAPCMNGGTCVEPEMCTCPANYTGSVCSEPVCIRTCLNVGQCTAPGVCTCTAEFTGDVCEVPICLDPCLNGGYCSAPNVCTCEDGYEGHNCGLPICNPPCLNDGACTNNRTCQCIQYYSGPQCEERLCSDFDHHVAFIGNLISEEGDRRLLIFPSANDSVEVTISGTLLPARTVQIPPDESYTVILDNGISVTHHSQRHKGLFVHAAGGKRVKVVAVNEESGSIGVVSSIPTAFPRDATYQFYALGVDSTLIAGVQSAVLLVGAYDNTTVNITTPYTLIHDRLLPAGQPFSITLHQGETYLIQHSQDLTGTYIESDKWLTVYSGHECGEVPKGRVKCDHLVDQVPPLSVWGQMYVVGALETQALGHQLKVLAGVGPTKVWIRCFNVTSGALVKDSTYNISSAGESVVIHVPEKQDCTIAANDKVLVAQLAQGQGTSSSFLGDPFLAFVPNTNMYVHRTRFTTIPTLNRIRANEMKNYINLIVQQKWFNVEDITLDGEKLSEFMAGNTTLRLVNFASGESYAVITLEVTPGLHLVEHFSPNALMAVLSYGFAGHWSYGYWTNTEEAMSCDEQFMPL